MTDRRRPHLLLVAWGFPPCRSGGVYRALATANRFAGGGWDVTVLTVPREVFVRYTGVDATLEDLVDPRVRVERVPFTWARLETDVRRFSRLRVRAPVLWRRLRTGLDRLPFPETGYGPWRAELERAAARVHAEHTVDLVLATANPHVAFTAAWALHRRAGVPYVLDYRDAWLLDVFDGRRLHGRASRAARWERRLVGSATEIWFVNEPIRRWHARLYPDAAARMHVVANGFDVSLASVARSRPDDSPLVFGYVGTLTPKVPLAEFLSGWTAARAIPSMAGAVVRVHGYLGFFHAPGRETQRLLDRAAAQGVSYEGPVGKLDAADTYAGFDVLLLLLGAGRYVTSGKVFEYLATGLPIVSVHDPGNAVAEVLGGYPLWFPVADLSAPEIARALVEAAAAARAGDPALRKAAVEYAEGFRRDRQLDPRIEALTDSVTARGPDPAGVQP